MKFSRKLKIVIFVVVVLFFHFKNFFIQLLLSVNAMSTTTETRGETKRLISEFIRNLSFLNTQCRSKGNISGGARERRRREPLEGSGGMLPQKILKSRGLEMPFPAFSKSYL